MLAIRKVVFYALVLIVTVSFARIFYLLINAGFFRDVDEISRLWKTDPIVSIYIPSGNQSRRCMREYETVHINSTLSAEASDLPHIFSKTWRGSPICVKRGGKSALSYKESYPFLYDRELPDKRGRCNDKLKKCGDGFDHNDGAICFPREDECPITNMLILPANQEPSAHAFWESAGTFQHSNHTLFVRRQVINELPINDIAFQLTQFDAHGENVRGVCYKGDNQIIFRAVTSSNNTLNGSYDATFPPACEVSDQRYVLVDQVPVQDHFLHNLDLTESAFATNKLNKSYASAVRAAFLDKENNITLGMYFSREVPWKDGCAASRTEILRGFLSAERSCFVFVFVTLFWLWGNGYWVFFGWEEFRYMDDIVGFFGVLVLVILGLMFMKSVICCSLAFLANVVRFYKNSDFYKNFINFTGDSIIPRGG